MAGKKGASRSATIKDMGKVKLEAKRLAKKYNWSSKEFLDYCLRMGVNRCLALERAEKNAGKPARKVKSKPRKVAKAKPRKATKPRAAASNAVAAPAASTPAAS